MFQFYPINIMAIWIIMGVSGSGKSTIGKMLSEQLGYEFVEGDDYHPECNIDKMAIGNALTDHDRKIWLCRLRAKIIAGYANGHSMVVTCSALKESYRKILRGNTECVKFIYLKGSYELIKKRLELRKGHFFNMDLLQNQMDTMEEPVDAVCIGVEDNVDNIVTELPTTSLLNMTNSLS